MEISVRDLLTWVEFVNKTVSGSQLSIADGLMHGCLLTFLDSMNPLDGVKQAAVRFLTSKISGVASDLTETYQEFHRSNDVIGCHPFYIPIGKQLR